MCYSISIIEGRVSVVGRGNGFFLSTKTECAEFIAELQRAGDAAFADVNGSTGLDVRAELSAIGRIIRAIPEVTDRRNVRFRLIEQFELLESEFPCGRDTELLMIETCLTYLRHVRELPGMRNRQGRANEAIRRLTAVYSELRV